MLIEAKYCERALESDSLVLSPGFNISSTPRQIDFTISVLFLMFKGHSLVGLSRHAGWSGEIGILSSL